MSHLQEKEHENQEEADLETPLILAAEAGKFFLTENYNLKTNNDVLNHNSAQTKPAEMEAFFKVITKDTHLNKILELQEKLQDNLSQLVNEKQNSSEILVLFEEHDKN